VGRVSTFTRSYLLEAHLVSFNRKLLTIGFEPEFADHLELVDNAKNRTLIQTKLSEFGFADVQLKFVRAEAPAIRGPIPQPVSETTPPHATASSAAPEKRPGLHGKSGRDPVPFKKDDFKNDPLIQKALEIFKGQIVEVRA